MTNRQVMVVLFTIALGCLVLLLDSVLSATVSSALELAPGREDQARIIYAFGAVGAALGMVLVGIADIGQRAR